MKSLYFIGSSLDDLRVFPQDARRCAGFELRRIQEGLEPTDWKPMKEVGAGAREIRVRCDDGAFRVFYVVWNDSAIYVLHAFQKKTQKTTQGDIDKGSKRYKAIEQ